MLEMGQPMHAFDERRVSSILVKTFDEQFKFRTLDGAERQIDTDTLMICTGASDSSDVELSSQEVDATAALRTYSSGQCPVACAGIMGGFESEIKDDTDSLLLESAAFDAVSIRKSSTRLGLRTDASSRYEKALDPELTVPAIARFLQLLQSVDPGAEVTSRLSDKINFMREKPVLSLEKSFVDRYTGIAIDNARIVEILTSLGFGVDLKDDVFTVTVPSWRATKDVTIPADLIEEITRVYGYDNFEIHSTRSVLYPVREDISRTQDTAARDFLVTNAKLHEVHSYLWCDREKFSALGLELEDNVRLLNSVNPNHETLRKSMIPTLLTFIQENRGYAEEYGMFEIGRVIAGVDAKNICNEKKHLGIVLYSREASEEELFFRLRDTLSDLILAIKRGRPVFAKIETSHAWQHPVNTFSAKLEGVEIAKLGAVHPANTRKIDKKAAIVYAEIDMDKLAAIPAAPIAYSEPSKFPGIEVDLSFVLGQEGVFASVAEAIAALDCALLTGYSLTDIFTPEDGALSVTVRLSFASNEKTLARTEIQPALDSLVGRLQAVGIALKA